MGSAQNFIHWLKSRPFLKKKKKKEPDNTQTTLDIPKLSSREGVALPEIPPPGFTILPDLSRDCKYSPYHAYFYEEIPAYAIDTQLDILRGTPSDRQYGYKSNYPYGAVVILRDMYTPPSRQCQLEINAAHSVVQRHQQQIDQDAGDEKQDDVPSYTRDTLPQQHRQYIQSWPVTGHSRTPMTDATDLLDQWIPLQDNIAVLYNTAHNTGQRSVCSPPDKCHSNNSRCGSDRDQNNHIRCKQTRDIHTTVGKYPERRTIEQHQTMGCSKHDPHSASSSAHKSYPSQIPCGVGHPHWSTNNAKVTGTGHSVAVQNDRAWIMTQLTPSSCHTGQNMDIGYKHEPRMHQPPRTDHVHKNGSDPLVSANHLSAFKPYCVHQPSIHPVSLSQTEIKSSDNHEAISHTPPNEMPYEERLSCRVFTNFKPVTSLQVECKRTLILDHPERVTQNKLLSDILKFNNDRQILSHDTVV